MAVETKSDKDIQLGKVLDDASHSLTIGSQIAIVTAEVGIDVKTVLAAKPFRDWVETISKEKRVEVSKVHFQSVDMFGKNVGFLKFIADAKVNGNKVPGIIFMRGGAVAILVILHHEGHEYALVVRQPRVPVGSYSFAEIPAGMLDGDRNFAGVAAREMKEETGIQITEDDLFDMTYEVYQDKYPGMFPSCGASDEFNRIFLYRKEVTAEQLASLNGKLTGVIEEGEMIKLQILPLKDLWRNSVDAKALAALSLYRKLHEAGRLEQPRFHPFALWRYLAGDFINSNLSDEPNVVKKHRKGNEASQVFICLFGWVGSLTLPLVLFDTSYAIGVILICLGVFYVLSPYDLIPDDKVKFGMPIGKFDDCGALAVAAAGVAQVARAHQESPIEFTQQNGIVVCVVVAMLIICYQFKTWRWLFAGVWAIVAQAAFFSQVIKYPTIQLGVILYFAGFLYNVLPVDLIKDERRIKGIPVGKVDDLVFGYLPAFLGIIVIILGLVTLVIG